MLFYFVSYVVNRYTANSPEEAVTNSEDKRGRNEGQGYLALCTDPKVVVIFACHFFYPVTQNVRYLCTVLG